MSELIEVPFGDNAKETAVLLLAAAEKVLGDQSVVLTTSEGFIAPEEVVKEAGAKPESEAPKPAKKAPAKKK